MSNELDGAWHAVYQEALSGEGVVILRSGKLIGCDQQYFFEGDYSALVDGHVSATIHVNHFAGEPRSIFHRGDTVRLVEYSAKLEGRIEGNRLLFEGEVDYSPLRFRVALTRQIPGPFSPQPGP
jgi:T3SS negative regulator,GrlR